MTDANYHVLSVDEMPSHTFALNACNQSTETHTMTVDELPRHTCQIPPREIIEGWCKNG